MKSKIYILTLLSAVVFNYSFAQKGKINSAQKKYDKLSYVKTSEELLEIANEGDASIDVLQKLANAYYFNGKMEEASKWYKALVALDGKEREDDEEMIEAESYFRYAQSLKNLEKYEEANTVFKKFKELSPNDSRANRAVSQMNYLEAIEKVSDDFQLKNLSVNTALSDFGASVYQGHLIFASARDLKQNIYTWNEQPFLDLYELNKNGQINEVKGDVNTRYHESSTAFTKDGKTMYFTRNNYFKKRFNKNSQNTHGLKIYKATLVDGEWTDVTSLPFNSDEYNVAHPTLSADEKTLYFASDMPGSIGASDIFMATINEDNTYGKPKNLGTKINTEGRENFPFISDEGTLYFSSDGHVGLGGLDVFKYENIDKMSSTDRMVSNLGKPINSSSDDFSYIINEATREGYITSNRAGGKGDDDIYSFVKNPCMQTVTGTVVNKSTNEAIPNAEVKLYDSNQKIVKTLTTNAKGIFSFEMACEENTFNALVNKETYKEDSKGFQVTTRSIEPIKLALQLEPIPQGPQAAAVGTDLFKLLGLEPLYFDYNKSFIRADAEIELAKIITYMKEFPTVKVDVRSHTDSRGRDTYNFALSNRRNKSTIEYIINRGGISRDRISGKGYGETQLVNRCSNGVKCSKEEHQRNRRSEFIVVAN